MRIVLAGQRWLGAEVFRSLRTLAGVQIIAVCAPADDRLRSAAEEAFVPVHGPGLVAGRQVLEDVDLLVCAHHQGFVSRAWRERARYGAIGYHPSLLPVHRGRDAVEWAVRMRDRVTGGTVYRMTGKADAGPVIIQQAVLIRPGETAADLWRRSLGPLGVDLLHRSVYAIAALGDKVPVTIQDEACATWEPALEVAPLRRRGT